MESDPTAKPASIDDLPNELLLIIFQYFKVKDLIRCSLVCKRFKIICKCIEIPELIITNKIENIKDCWFYTNKPFNQKDAIDVKTFVSYQSIFRLDKIRRLHFTAPRLEMLKCWTFSLITLTYPSTIRHLEADGHSECIRMMKNLQFIQVGFKLEIATSNILSIFPKLRTLAFRYHNYYLGSDMEMLRYLVNRKTIKQRPELKIYMECVEVDIRKIDEFVNGWDALAFQINNYNSLCENITCTFGFNYNELMGLVKGKIPDDFSKKYFSTRCISVTENVEDQQHLFRFLKSFEYLRKLRLRTDSLNQSLFDSLCELDQLTSLTVENASKSIVNFDFLLKLKLLGDFWTTSDSPKFFDLALELFKHLKYFWSMSFHFDAGYIVIRKILNDNKYLFRYMVEDGKTGKILFEQKDLDYNGLVSAVEAFRFSKVDTVNQD